MDRYFPQLAARLTHTLMSSPPRFRPSRSEWALMASAQKWRLPFQGGWLQCYRWGDGPVCLFVHCWGGRGAQAEHMIRHLAGNGMSVISFDHPAHGQSSGRTSEMMRMSAATAAVARNVGPVDTLIGHSLGVAASAIAMRDHSMVVRRLVSISSLTHCTWFTDVIGEYLGISKSTIERAQLIVTSSYVQPFDWASLSVVKILSELEMPVLLIHDRDDAEIPFEHGEALSRALSRAEFRATSGLGHRRLLKDSDVLQHITQFVKQEVSA